MPSFEVKNSADLKQWLIRELEPICDADPEVLSDYVLALLKHDESDSALQAKLSEQLEDFLAEQTDAFVGKTLDALRTQSYLPASKRGGAAPTSPAPAGSSGTSRKRSADDEGRDAPTKSHRDLDGNADGRRRESDMRERREGSSSATGAEVGPARGKAMCRDFHQRGFCSRGESCRYDHTLPASIDGFMNPVMFGANGMHLPHMGQAQHQQPQHFGPPHMQQPQQQHQQHQQQQHPLQYSPMPGQMQMGMPPQFGMHGPPMGWNGMKPVEGASSGNDSGVMNHMAFNNQYSNSNAEANGTGMQHAGRSDFGGHRGGNRGAMRGAGRGGGGTRGTFEKRPTSSTTLVIENVPQEHLELVKVNEYFKKFGTITNIQIDVDSKKALVSFSQPAEAKAAHSSPEVIFNNRFVKVYFQKLDDPFVKPKETPPAVVAPPPKSNFVPGQTSNKFVRPNLAQERAKGHQEQAQKKLDALMAEQKEVMAKLTAGSASQDEKKTLMSRFGTLEGEIKQATEEVRNAVNGGGTTSSAKQASSEEWKDQRERREREQLDRELEALQNGSSSNGATTEELKATLARLRNEAEQLGIDANNPAASSSFRGGFRGRGRGAYRGGNTYFRGGRGGSAFNRSTMSLDNRTSRLHIFDLPDGSTDEQKEKVKEHLKQFGEVNAVEDKDDGSFIVQYAARSSGEVAVRSGLAVPDVGTVKAQWTSEGTQPRMSSASAVGTSLTDGSGVEAHETEANGTVEANEGDFGEDELRDREDNFRR